MNISELSIKRPVLALVMTLMILIFGAIGYLNLGIREYPSVDKPVISVSTSYPGANPEVVMNQITEPLEQNINGIPGIRSLVSSSSQGRSNITVEFELDVDMERAANDVRDKVSVAQRFLPRDCDPPTVAKADADSDPILRVAVRSDEMSVMQLTEIAETTIKERLQTINGVSAVSIYGRRYSMRLWLDPVKMAGFGITPIDVKNAVDKENVELPSGNIEGDKVVLTIRTLGLMSTPEEFNDLVIKETDGAIIRFSDIGYAEVAPEDQRSIMRMDGKAGVMIMLVPQPGANHIDIADQAYERLEQMKKDLPEGVTCSIFNDTTKFIRASINEVRETIYIAFLLVVLIIFLFLRDWRVTLVPVAVIPISLIGAFFIMYIFGFSINVLTMLAIVLSVGLVVDDAIVVSENIYLRIEKGAKPIQAGIEGSREIFFAVISTTITLVAVFLPIIFLDGMTGMLFKEFSLVIAGSVIISSFAALTITPMFATKILKQRTQKNYFYRLTEPFFEGMNRYYDRSLGYFLQHRYWALVTILLLVGVIVYFGSKVPSELAPLEDRSLLIISSTAPEGTTFDYTNQYSKRMEDDIYAAVPEVSDGFMMRVANGNIIGIMSLPNIADRERTQAEIAQVTSKAIMKHTEARSFVRQRSSLSSGKSGMPVQYVLQAQSIDKLQEVIPRFMDEVNASSVLTMGDVDFKFTNPELLVEINRDKANLMGVNTINIAQTMQYGLSGQRMGYYYYHGKQYQILAEIDREDRNAPIDLASLFVRSQTGDMIQLDNLVETHESVTSPRLYRYDRFVAATISANLAPGKTLGDGLNEMDKIAEKVLDNSFRTTLAGDSKEFRESSSSLYFAFGLALILIFLVLAAQFESFKDPLVMMLTVPLAMAGAILFMYLMGVTMNIFSQIGIIMLIGLVVKNGILIVEFANQRQNEGLSKFEAVQTASVQRLRPILMTSASTILGLLPLVFASAEGANSRIAMGVAVVGGMLLSTLLTLFVVPAMYSYLSTDRTQKAIRLAAKNN